MSVLTITASAAAEHRVELEDSARKMFAAIEQAHPDNIRYGSCRLVDDSYLIVLQVDDGTENPLPGIEEFRAFQAGLATWTGGQSTVRPATVVGSYRLF